MGTTDKLRAVRAAIGMLEKQFGKGAVMTLGEDDVREPVAVIPSGSLAIDLALEGDEEWSDEADWPEADTLERSGVSYVSQPVAVTRVEPDVVELTRLRITDDGPPEVDRVREWDASLSELLEAVEPVLGLEGVHPVPATAAWAGTEIVVLR